MSEYSSIIVIEENKLFFKKSIAFVSEVRRFPFKSLSIKRENKDVVSKNINIYDAAFYLVGAINIADKLGNLDNLVITSALVKDTNDSFAPFVLNFQPGNHFPDEIYFTFPVPYFNLTIDIDFTGEINGIPISSNIKNIIPSFKRY
jgi:hypothetical protein